MTEFLPHFNRVLTLLVGRDRIRSLFPIIDRLPLPSNIRMQRSVDELRALMIKMIKEKRQKQASGADTKSDLLDLLLRFGDEDGRTLTEEQLIQNLVLLFMCVRRRLLPGC